jgi:uncharacterized protein
MQSRPLTVEQPAAPRMFALVLDTGDEFVACATGFAREQRLSGAQFSAIGAFSSVVLGYFDWDTKAYQRIAIDEQVEVVSLLGDIALKDDQPNLHPHVVVAKRDGSAWGGHLLEGRVRPTLEIVITETPAALVRRHDPTTGLALLRL